MLWELGLSFDLDLSFDNRPMKYRIGILDKEELNNLNACVTNEEILH
jgi:hypothetical protein